MGGPISAGGRVMFSAVSKPLDVDDDDEDEDSEGPAHAVFTQRGH